MAPQTFHAKGPAELDQLFCDASGIIAPLLTGLRVFDSPETPTVLSILVFEDLVMVAYLPFVAVLIRRQSHRSLSATCDK